MAAAGGGTLLAGKGIGGTIEEIRGIGIVFRAAFGAVIIHLFAAVGTVQKASQRIHFTQRVNALWRLAELLRKLPCLPVHDGLVGILEDQPILLGIHHGVFILIGLLVGAEIHRMPHILRLGEDLPHDVAAPRRKLPRRSANGICFPVVAIDGAVGVVSLENTDPGVSTGNAANTSDNIQSSASGSSDSDNMDSNKGNEENLNVCGTVLCS